MAPLSRGGKEISQSYASSYYWHGRGRLVESKGHSERKPFNQKKKKKKKKKKAIFEGNRYSKRAKIIRTARRGNSTF